MATFLGMACALKKKLMQNFKFVANSKPQRTATYRDGAEALRHPGSRKILVR